MRARIALLIIVVTVSAAVSIVRAQEPVKCNGTETLTHIIDTLQITDDTQAYIKSLQAVKDIADAQIKACQNAQVNNVEPSETSEPSNTPLPSYTPFVTLSAAEAQGATRTAIYDARTATASARGATATFVAQYKPIDARELMDYAERHKGEKVIVKGTVFNVGSKSGYIQILINGNYSYDLWVNLKELPQGIYVNDYVTVYGTVNGYYSYEAKNGNKAEEPQLIDAVVTKP